MIREGRRDMVANHGAKGEEVDVPVDIVTVTLVLTPDPEMDAEASERLSRGLRAEVHQLDVELINAPGRMAPPGTKGTDLVTVGTIIVALSASGGVFTALIDTARGWLSQRTGRHRISVTIDGDTLELDQATSRQQQDLVNAFIDRHSTRK